MRVSSRHRHHHLRSSSLGVLLLRIPPSSERMECELVSLDMGCLADPLLRPPCSRSQSLALCSKPQKILPSAWDAPCTFIGGGEDTVPVIWSPVPVI
ncbi:hypothetical protein Taro_023399 [Colocasia esculenta]|uniref:Uncharacterized protein n=1 Tax=Colocasia esculenta TaxID=4460 RepID=A0A843VEE8_COLES|nr:hypothetical protein [Colocasia esculenta]